MPLPIVMPTMSAVPPQKPMTRLRSVVAFHKVRRAGLAVTIAPRDPPYYFALTKAIPPGWEICTCVPVGVRWPFL